MYELMGRVDKRLGGFVAYLEREVNGAVACL